MVDIITMVAIGRVKDKRIIGCIITFHVTNLHDVNPRVGREIKKKDRVRPA